MKNLILSLALILGLYGCTKPPLPTPPPTPHVISLSYNTNSGTSGLGKMDYFINGIEKSWYGAPFALTFNANVGDVIIAEEENNTWQTASITLQEDNGSPQISTAGFGPNICSLKYTVK